MPHLVQFRALTPAHFIDSPVWASVRSFDHDEPWFGDTDEETFRPWEGPLPVSPNDGMFLVRAHFALADQARLDGFLTPATSGPSNDRVLGEIQPQLFLDTGKRIAFWLGMFGNPSSAAQELYAALAKNADAVFPMQFRALDGLASGITRGELRGFYIIPDGQTVDIIR